MPNKKKSVNKIIILVLSLALGIFFILWGAMHTTLAEMTPHLHFCSYFACIIFSLIWFAFSGIAIYFLTSKKKRKKKMGKVWYIPMIVILVVGLILMNLTYCDTDGMHFGFGEGGFLGGEGTDTCTSGVDCPGDVVEVPIPPCLETDDGQDYITPGMILSGANLEDVCMSGDLLRERYCNSELTYTSEDVSCSDLFGDDWICEDKECILEETPPGTPAGDDGGSSEDNAILCDDGVDNDDDDAIDCEDPDCILYCEDCSHSLDFPDCNAYCSSGSCEPMYAETGGWCECLPDGEVPCFGSEQTMPIFCGGWCPEQMFCIHDEIDCYCSDFPCRDTDEGYDIETPGECIGDDVWFYESCAGDVLTEWQCLDGCTSFEVDCEELWGGTGVCVTDKDGIGYCTEFVP